MSNSFIPPVQAQVDKFLVLLGSPFGLVIYAVGLLLAWVIPIVASFLFCFGTPLLTAVYPLGNVVFGTIVIVGTAFFQWKILSKYLLLKRNNWLLANLLGVSLGLEVGAYLARPQPLWEMNSLGWGIYDAKLFAVAGLVMGLALWLPLRKVVKYSGWLILMGAIAGLCAGTFEGQLKDSTILAFEHTTSDPSEGLLAASMVAVPGAFIIFEIIIGASLAVILVQYSHQKTSPLTWSNTTSSLWRRLESLLITVVLGICLVLAGYSLYIQLFIPDIFADKSALHPEYVSALNNYFNVVDYLSKYKDQIDLCQQITLDKELPQCQYDLKIGKNDGFSSPRSVKQFWIYEETIDCVVLITNLHWAGTTVNRAFMLWNRDDQWKVANSEPVDPFGYTRTDYNFEFSCLK